MTYVFLAVDTDEVTALVLTVAAGRRLAGAVGAGTGRYGSTGGRGGRRGEGSRQNEEGESECLHGDDGRLGAVEGLVVNE